MTLELQLAVFPQTAEDNKKLFKEKYDANKKYPSHSGTIKVPVSQLPELVSYLQNAKPDNDGYIGDFVPLRATGYVNTPKNNPNGKKYLAMKITSDYNKQKEIYEGGSTQPQMTNRNPVDTPLVPPFGDDEIGF